MSKSAIEPMLARFSNPWLRYFAATPPAFLMATLAACLLGQAVAIIFADASGMPYALLATNLLYIN